MGLNFFITDIKRCLCAEIVREKRQVNLMTVDCVGYFNLSDLRREQLYKLKTILRKSVCRKSVYRSLRKSRGQLILVTPPEVNLML